MQKMYPKITETSKLLARQSLLFENMDRVKITRTHLFSAFSKLFYKTLRLFLKKLKISPKNLDGLFSFMVQGT